MDDSHVLPNRVRLAVVRRALSAFVTAARGRQTSHTRTGGRSNTPELEAIGIMSDMLSVMYAPSRAISRHLAPSRAISRHLPPSPAPISMRDTSV